MSPETQSPSTAEAGTPSAAPRGLRIGWVAGAACLLLAAVAGGLAGAAFAGRGPDRVCAADEVAAKGLPSVVTIEAQSAGAAGTGSVR